MSTGQIDERPIVFHVVTSLDFGGVEKRMEVVAGLDENARLAHRFCAIGGGGKTFGRLGAVGADVVCLGQSPRIASVGALTSLVRLFLRTRPWVVHTHGAEANFHGLLAAWLTGVPVRIGEEIGIPSHRARAKRVFSLVYRAAHRVVGISDAVTAWLVQSGEVPSNKAVRVYNPVLIPAYACIRSRSPGTFRIGFVGRLEPVKNPLALVEAVAFLRDEGYQAELWLVGEGSERPRIERLTRDAGLEPCVRILGYQADPSRYMKECDLYIQPSLSEGFGLALVEAMGAGMPVIATAVGGAPEIIDHGRTGWLLADSTSKSLAEAVRGAMDAEPAALEAMGQAARASVLKRFEPRLYLDQLESLYLGSLLGDETEQDRGEA